MSDKRCCGTTYPRIMPLAGLVQKRQRLRLTSAVFAVAACIPGLVAIAQTGDGTLATISSIYVESQHEYTNANGPDRLRPLADVASILRAAGRSVVDSPASADGVLKLRLRGSALKASYHPNRTLYTGAKWECSLTLESGESTVFERDFDCTQSPPFHAEYRTPPDAPEDAPFEAALYNCRTFWWPFVDMVQTLWGPDHAVKAALAVPLNSGLHLAELGDKAVPTMLRYLKPRSTGAPVFQDLGTAVQFFGNFKDSRSVEPMIRLLEDPSLGIPGNLIRTTMRALGHQGDVRAVPALIKRLPDCDREGVDCSWAVEALAELGDPRAVPDLIRVASNTELGWPTRRPAIDALGKIGDPRAIPALEEAAKESETNISFPARSALELIAKH